MLGAALFMIVSALRIPFPDFRAQVAIAIFPLYPEEKVTFEMRQVVFR